MVYERGCENCNAGCTGRHDAEQRAEEIKSGPYLLFAGILILAFSLIMKWYFF